ncbi:MAG: T9SS type A sorting domain-containing protein [Bacteroidota bacterium]
MERKDFLKAAGALGIASIIPFKKAHALANKLTKAASSTCVLIPQETAGPYPLNLSGNAAMFRQDITESFPGIPMNLFLTVVDINNNCNPVPNLRIDIWHCNKDGYYSGFVNPGYLGTQNNVGQTFFRGIQITDLNGQVQFITIYPGWYTGRVTHIHLQVFLNSVLAATSQMAFQDSLNTIINNTPLYAPHGQNSVVNATDGVFSDTNNTQYELLNVTPNGTTGGYDASLIIGLAVPSTGVINLEPETGGQFKLNQNYPNPFKSKTTIPFTLKFSSHVKLEIFDVNGKKLIELVNTEKDAGDHKIILDRNVNGNKLPAGNYPFQLTTENSNGIYFQAKVLTVE